MKEAYFKSLQMIKRLDLKNEKQYNELLKNYLLLNSESLKYISQTRSFKKIIKIAKEVAQTSSILIKMNIIYSNQYVVLSIRVDKKFHIRKLYFSTIVDKKYGIQIFGHTNTKVEMYENRDFTKANQKRKTDIVQNNQQK